MARMSALSVPHEMGLLIFSYKKLLMRIELRRIFIASSFSRAATISSVATHRPYTWLRSSPRKYLGPLLP